MDSTKEQSEFERRSKKKFLGKAKRSVERKQRANEAKSERMQ